MTPRQAACQSAASAILLASYHKVTLLELADALVERGAFDEYGGLAQTITECLTDRYEQARDALARAVDAA